MYEIYIPDNLRFSDFMAICQLARTLVDGYDRKDPERLRAALAPNFSLDYTLALPNVTKRSYTVDAFVEECLSPRLLGDKFVRTQHILGLPYFKSVTEEKIVVEWQQIASHGRVSSDADPADNNAKIVEHCNVRSYLLHEYVKIHGVWKVAFIQPQAIFQPGDLSRILGLQAVWQDPSIQ